MQFLLCTVHLHVGSLSGLSQTIVKPICAHCSEPRLLILRLLCCATVIPLEVQKSLNEVPSNLNGPWVWSEATTQDGAKYLALLQCKQEVGTCVLDNPCQLEQTASLFWEYKYLSMKMENNCHVGVLEVAASMVTSVNTKIH